MVIRQTLIRIATAAALGAACVALPLAPRQASAADLDYGYAPPSPCAQYSAAYRERLAAMRGTARLFNAQRRRFSRLKRRRHNNGFYGPDIALNAAMTAEQIEVASTAAEVTDIVDRARRFGCPARGALNAAENAAFRLDRAVAMDAIWIDPRTFW